MALKNQMRLGWIYEHVNAVGLKLQYSVSGLLHLAMHPLPMHGYLLWCILFVYIYMPALSFSLGLNSGREIASSNLLHSLESDLSNNFKSSTSSYLKTSSLSSPLNTNVSCGDLGGVGSFNTTCLLNSNLYLNSDLYIYGTGNLEILPHVSIVCPIEGCMITFNMSGNINVGEDAAIIAGSVVFSAANLTMEHGSFINTTSLGGLPPSQTSGTPIGYDGAGGGHGGRGASCLKNKKKSFWGGDVYAWSTLAKPWSYGSKGGGTSDEYQFGGGGGGCVLLISKDILYLNGSVFAEGGDGGLKGGGGSGGSIFVIALKL